MRWLTALKTWEQWTKQAESRLTGELQNLFGGVMEKTVDELIRRGRIPNNDIAVQMLLKDFKALKDPMGTIISDAAIESAGVGRAQVFYDMARMGSELVFSEFSTRMLGLISQHAFVASNGTMSRMVGDVMGNLAESFRKGLGIDEAAESLNAVFQGMHDWELRRVARTEINCFQSQGAYMTERELGVEYHQWWSAEDARVRDSHIEMHGQIVRVGDRFTNGLLYPGDRDGAIEEWINCRCRPVCFLMPEGYAPPPGADYFYEEDLVPVSVEEKMPDLMDDAFAEELKKKMDAITGADQYAKRLELMQKELEAAIQKKLAEGKTIMNLLPDYYDAGIPDFLKKDFLNNILTGVSNLSGDEWQNLQDKISGTMQWISMRVHPDLLQRAGALNSLRYAPNARSDYAKAYKRIRWNGDRASVLVHEYGHHLHFYGGDNLQKTVSAFMAERIEGKNLTEIYKGSGEMGWRDKFYTHYVGKVYDWENPAAPDGTEVVSMGLELMGRTPEYLYQKDPGHFRLIYAIMRGII